MLVGPWLCTVFCSNISSVQAMKHSVGYCLEALCQQMTTCFEPKLTLFAHLVNIRRISICLQPGVSILWLAPRHASFQAQQSRGCSDWLSKPSGFLTLLRSRCWSGWELISLPSNVSIAHVCVVLLTVACDPRVLWFYSWLSKCLDVLLFFFHTLTAKC